MVYLMAREYHIQFSSKALLPHLVRRRPRYCSVGAVAKRDLKRYYAMLKMTLLTVKLSQEELEFICSAHCGSPFMGDAALQVDNDQELNSFTRFFLTGLAGVNKSLNGFGEAEAKFVGFDTTALDEKIKGWSVWQTLAVADVIERIFDGEATVEEILKEMNGTEPLGISEL